MFFSSFSICDRKDVKTLKKMISTWELWQRTHLLVKIHTRYNNRKNMIFCIISHNVFLNIFSGWFQHQFHRRSSNTSVKSSAGLQCKASWWGKILDLGHCDWPGYLTLCDWCPLNKFSDCKPSCWFLLNLLNFCMGLHRGLAEV